MFDYEWTQFDDADLANHFESSHWAHLPGADGRHLVTFTGIVKCGDTDFVGQDSHNWTDRTLGLALKFPLDCPPGQHFHIETFAPFFTISGVDKGGDNHNGGWAVNDFNFAWPGEVLNIYDQVHIRATIRTRGDLFRLFRIGYTVTVCGYFENN